MPAIQASVLFYVPDGWDTMWPTHSQPLHDTVNVAGWVLKDNPNGYTRKGDVHQRLEAVTDRAIEEGKITDKDNLKLEAASRVVGDPFVCALMFIRQENGRAEQVYIFDKEGAIQDAGTPEFRKFTEERMAEGAALLRDLIYTAWENSGGTKALQVGPDVSLEQTSPAR